MTAAEAAAKLHVSSQRIRQWIAAGRLPATHHGRDWWIEPKDLEQFASLPRQNGRPSRKE